jgi:F0F1-type ATP synthase membrane subunit c/vacuolar-type H+-ATPase subunit K
MKKRPEQLVIGAGMAVAACSQWLSESDRSFIIGLLLIAAFVGVFGFYGLAGAIARSMRESNRATR